jgi:RNA polymerase sigma-70 factor, ECF subfamily
VLTSISGVPGYGIPLVDAARSHGTAAIGCERRQQFENILSQALPRFRNIAMRSLRNPDDADDAVQDAMLSACKHIAQFDGRAQISTWLTSIVINAARMHSRRERAHVKLSLDESPTDGQSAISELLADPSPNPEQILARRELREVVNKLIGGLPAGQREALRLHQQDEFSVKSAAATLGVPLGTLKAQLTRGRAALSERFQNATRKTKARSSNSDLIAARQTRCFNERRDRTQPATNLPVVRFQQEGGRNSWIA